MTRLIVFGIALAVLQSCNPGAQSDTTSTTDSTSAMGNDNDSGWISLSLDKWHTYGKPTLEAGWSIQDSALFLDTAATARDAGVIESAIIW